MSKIKVAICDDAHYLCESFKMIFEREEDIDYVGEAFSSDECFELIKNTLPDILLLDIQMETATSGIDIIRHLKEIHPKLKVIMLTSFDDENYVFSSFANGADDYFIKSNSNDDLLQTIRSAYNNHHSIRPEIAQKISTTAKELNEKQQSFLYILNVMIKLSPSELDLVKSVYNGKSYRNIAKERVVEVNAIRQMASRILKKMDCTSMNELVKWLKDLQIFEVL